MYSDSDLEAAVAAGALSPAAADGLRDFVAASRQAPLADEEHFRLITGFNDIFVSIAAVLLLVAVGWIGGSVARPLAGAAVAATAWGLAEYFTAKRRMALPSILLLLAFVGGVSACLAALVGAGLRGAEPTPDVDNGVLGLQWMVTTGGAAVAAWLHWRRFRVPITVAAGAAALAGLAVSLILSAFPQADRPTSPVFLLAGLAVFAFAMWWDMSDPTRTTRRSDVAFWLHLLAAPLIVHPVFQMLGLLSGSATVAEGVIVLALYVALGVIALAIDRRALMVSALAYVLYALSALFREFGAVSLSLALTALVIGSALLLLSAFWQVARAAVLARLPDRFRTRLPAPAMPA